VVVTDRGPYTGGRVLDLSEAAAKDLGIDGVSTVRAEVLARE
jgi:rare lipoprotein A (peptidoglycan hydrolase)